VTSPHAPKPKRRSTAPPEQRARLRRLNLSELPTETVALARFLIGTTLVSHGAQGRAAARIVETEAYLPGDAAAHSYRGETARNRSLFLRPGHAYVYFIYGMYFCMNVSSEGAGIGAGVLIRSGEPTHGLKLMERRRPGVPTHDLCRGPGKLASALGISRLHDGLDLTAAGPLWLASASAPVPQIALSRRIGIVKEAERMLRFFERDSPFVSGPKRARYEDR